MRHRSAVKTLPRADAEPPPFRDQNPLAFNVVQGVARIATYGEQAVDVFYVKDLFGHKVTHERKLAQIEARLLEALAEPEERSEKAA